MRFLFFFLVLIGCSKTAPQNTEKKVPVQITQLKVRDVPRYFEAHGVLVPILQAEIRSQVAGRVLKILYQEGQNVEKGKLLVEIDPTLYELRLEEANASLAQKNALKTFAEKKLDRYTSISDHHLAAIELDQLQQELALHRAAVKAEEARVKQATIDVQNCSIYAPFSGKIGRSFIGEANLVPVLAHFTTLRNLDSLYVEFPVTEEELLNLSTLSSLEIKTLTGSAPIPGQFFSLDNEIDSKTGTIFAKGSVANPNHTLWPGQIVSVRCLLAVEKDVSFLPVEAIQQNLKGKFVYVIDKDQTAQERPVVLGASQDKEIAILSGLSPDDQIVLKGQLRLYNGAYVEIKE